MLSVGEPDARRRRSMAARNSRSIWSPLSSPDVSATPSYSNVAVEVAREVRVADLSDRRLPADSGRERDVGGDTGYM